MGSSTQCEVPIAAAQIVVYPEALSALEACDTCDMLRHQGRILSRPSRVQHAIRRRLAHWLDPARSSHTPDPRSYYDQQPSCQIGNLWFLLARFLGERSDGTFVEVGAHDGVFVSNTWGPAKRGWRGVMVEPVPTLAAQCRANHQAHPRVTVVETGIGPPGVSEICLYLAGTLTTANAEVLDEYSRVGWARDALTDEELVVPCQTLDSLLRDQGVAPALDLLVIDVEGYEAEVFAGFDLRHWSPKMLIVELVDTHPDLSTSARCDATLGVQIAETGYTIVYKDSINTVFVRNEVWRETFDSAESDPD